VPNSRDASDERLNELYRDHPDEFVAGRNQLAKEIRAAGDRDEAERVRKLRRPTVAAWLINRAALTSPSRLEEFAEASRRLEEAQGKALEGKDEGASEWRAAAERETEATGAIVEIADSGARDAGHPPSQRALELVVETLRAASGDPELRERVLRGRVEREQSAATLGTLTVGPPPKRERRSAKQRGIAQARRELQRLRDELADATEREETLRARVEQTTQTLRREKTKLADSKRETAALKRQVKAAERRANS
jgi:hypothetical protein